MKFDEDEDFTIKRDSETRTNHSASGPSSANSRFSDSGGNALPEGTRVREFEIKGVLGEGGFSIVYLAWDHSLHRQIALKEYIPASLASRNSDLEVTARSFRDRENFEIGLRSFVNEARLLATFDHPSLVKVHQFWNERGTAYIAMPLYRGATLKNNLAARTEPVTEKWLKTILIPITDALSVIHSHQCYHRDIAPDNILILEPSQKPLLLDFGAARKVIGDLTQDLTVILKSGYAPIEQYGDIPGMKQGPWTDVYALAAVVHFAIAGRTPPTSVSRLANDTYQPLAGKNRANFSHRFLATLDRALSVRPEQRPQTIEDFRKQLGLDELEPESKRRPRYLLVTALVGTGVAMAVIAVFVFLRSPATAASAVSQMAVKRPVATKPLEAQAVISSHATEIPATPANLPPVDERSRALEVSAADKLQNVLTDLEQLSQEEKKDASGSIRDIRTAQANAESARNLKDYLRALKYDDQGYELAKTSLNGLVTELVQGYSNIARQATAIEKYQIAQNALNRAKQIQAMQRF